jgi:hypothetical protein
MSQQIGERYRCSDPDCGCEVEIKRPSTMSAIVEEPPRTQRPIGSSPELSARPSTVSVPREDFSLQEGAGQRGSSYGSPKVEEGTRGPFRTDEGAEDTATATETVSTTAIDMGNLICFCGSPMELASGRSMSARAGTL